MWICWGAKSGFVGVRGSAAAQDPSGRSPCSDSPSQASRPLCQLHLELAKTGWGPWLQKLQVFMAVKTFYGVLVLSL